MSRRTQAAIAVGLLAFSGVGGPATAVAAGPDQDVEGSVEVIESPDPTADLDESTSGWIDGGAAPAEDEPAAVEPEEGPVEPTPREPAEEPAGDVAEEVEYPDAVTEPATEPVALAAPPAEDPIATTESAVPEGIRVDTAERAKRERPVKRAKPAVQPRVIIAPAPAPAPAPTTAAPVRVVAGTNQGTAVRAESGDRFHVVQRGESLWSIATDLLGERADTSQVAREVDRLWELNEDRIASGNPDLLYTGARLRLR